MSDEDLMSRIAEAAHNAREREMDNLRRKKQQADQDRLLDIERASDDLIRQVINKWDPGNPGAFRILIRRSYVRDVIANLRGKGFTEENFWVLWTENLAGQDDFVANNTSLVLEVILPIGLPEGQEIKRWPTDEEAGSRYGDKVDFRKCVAGLVDRIQSEGSFEHTFTARKVRDGHLKALKRRLEEAGFAKHPWSITTSLHDERQGDYWFNVTVSRSR